LSAAVVAERAGVSRSTLWQIEKGNASVALGSYFLVLFALSLEQDLLLVAKDDVLGRKLQDAGLITRKRALRAKRAVQS
jgi:transcriptional regulator with XRE-family HTH domain